MKPAVLLLLGALLFAQKPQIDNAALSENALAGTLAATLPQFGAGPYWAGYSEPIVAGRRGDMCSGTLALGSPMRLEGQTGLVVLARISGGGIDELRVISPDCHLDAGGLPFHWIGNVPPAASIAWLKAQVPVSHADTAIMAISLHGDAEALRAMEDLTAATQSESVRKRAAFWLGNTRGADGVAILKRMLANDPSASVRDQVISALSGSRDPGALPVLIDAARNDKDPHLRGQALIYLAQKAATQQVKDVIGDAVSNDAEAAVRDQAVTALSRIPNGDGVPLLIDVAKNSRYPEVRKKAVFWLGQSKDPRALDYIAQVLKP